jgi:hypothetical protein
MGPQLKGAHEPQWVDFLITESEVEAHVVRGVLDASGIGARVWPNPAVLNLLHLGPVRVRVPRDQFFAAQRALREARLVGDRCYRFEVIDGGLA